MRLRGAEKDPSALRNYLDTGHRMYLHPLGVIRIAHIAADNLHMRPDGGNLYRVREVVASGLRIRLCHFELANYLKDQVAAFIAQISWIQEVFKSSINFSHP